MDARKWIKWADFGDDGEPNGCWCIGDGGNQVAVAVTVAATEEEANALAAAPELLAALEDITKNSFAVSTGNVSGLSGCTVMVRVEDIEAARAAILKAKGGTGRGRGMGDAGSGGGGALCCRPRLERTDAGGGVDSLRRPDRSAHGVGMKPADRAVAVTLLAMLAEIMTLLSPLFWVLTAALALLAVTQWVIVVETKEEE